jgi:hypothetical protein
MYKSYTLYFTPDTVLTYQYDEIGSVSKTTSAKRVGMMVELKTSVGKVHGSSPY